MKTLFLTGATATVLAAATPAPATAQSNSSSWVNKIRRYGGGKSSASDRRATATGADYQRVLRPDPPEWHKVPPEIPSAEQREAVLLRTLRSHAGAPSKLICRPL